MSAVLVRVRTTVIAAVALVAALVTSHVLIPVVGGVGPAWLRFTLALLVLGCIVGGAVLLSLRLTGLRRVPAGPGFDLDGATFTVPTSLRPQGVVAVLGMVAAGVAALTDPVVSVLLAGFAVAYLWLFRYSVTFTPAGVVVTAMRGRCAVLWSELLPGGPVPPTRVTRNMRLRYQRPGERPKVLCLTLAYLQVDRLFLATVIRHYAEQPQRRPGIGTPAELERLTAGFAAWRGQPAAEPMAAAAGRRRPGPGSAR